MKNSNPFSRFFLLFPCNAFFILMLFSMLLSSCFLFPKKKEPKPSVAKTDSTFIILKAPGINASDFYAYINEHKGSSNPYYCSTCDSSLVLVDRAFLEQILGPVAQSAVGGSLPSVDPSGGPEGFWSLNFPIFLDDSLAHLTGADTVRRNYSYGKFTDSNSVVVAILDTGIDTAKINSSPYFYTSNLNSCLGNRARIGWSFPDKSDATNDNYNPLAGHGANVAGLVAEQVEIIGKTPAKILPVKFISSNGKGNLYDVLCGISYAVDRGASIVNASFGYYQCNSIPAGQVDSGALVFKSFIKKYLTDNSILLITAAGNRENNNCGRNNRNLDKVRFYPASFAGDPELPNVISVTTISKADPAIVSPLQNFSANVVDVGVYADMIDGGGQRFGIKNPRVISDVYITGSSYAAPVVTGKIAGYYNDIKSAIGSGQITKDAVLNYLISQSAVLVDNQLQSGKIRRNLATVHKILP